MNSIVRYLRRWVLFNKRLLKKPAFVVILLLVPMLVFAMSFVSKNEKSGILTVAVSCEDPQDAIASEIKESLLNERSLIYFVDCPSPEKALELVASAEVDCAWIFPDDMQKRIEDFSENISRRRSFITVVQRENNVLIQLSYEKLHAVLYPYCARELYVNFVRDNFESLDAETDAYILEFFSLAEVEGEDMFAFSSITPDSDKSASADYLLAPLRGLQAILVVIAGLAVSLFYMQDEKAGKFDWVSDRKKPALAFAYHFTAVADVALVVFVSLIVSGLSVSLGRELISMALLAFFTVGFCIALRLLCRDIRIFGAIMPVVTIAMIVFCPIFFDSIRMGVFNYLLPPFCYLKGIYNTNYLYYMAIFGVCIYAFDYLLFRIRTR